MDTGARGRIYRSRRLRIKRGLVALGALAIPAILTLILMGMM